MAQKKIKELFKIISGYTFRKSPIPSFLGGTYLLQAKDVINHFILTHDSLEKISFDPNQTAATTRTGDIVITTRGNFRAAVIQSPHPIIVSSSVFILRPIEDEVVPAYVAIYLNSIEGRYSLSKLMSGGSIASLLKAQLQEMVIPIPSLSKQRVVVRLHENIFSQKELAQRKMKIIQNVSEHVIHSIVTNK